MKKDNKSWQSRMAQDQAEIAVDFVESISVDHRLYRHDIAGSIAHAGMLCEQGLITKGEYAKIRKGLLGIQSDIEAGRFVFDKRFEDIHMVIEAELINRIGDAGKKLHTGRSRNDQVALDMRLWTRQAIDEMIAAINNLQRVLAVKAEEYGDLIMPGYTHLQRAQPVLAGHYLLVFVEQLQRDKERFEDSRKRANVCPLGSGALAGSTLPLDRDLTAKLLDFPAITRNSIDSISDRDFCAEYVFACSLTATHLSRLAEDWILFCSQEFGFIRIADAYSTGSSMMPQKRNPDMMELIRGKCGGVYGNLMALLTMLKGLPAGYNRDMQEDKKQVFDANDTVLACIQMAAAVVANTAFKPDGIADGLEEGFLDATVLAEYLVGKGIPFRQAHHYVGKLVSEAEAKGLTLAQIPLADYQATCQKIEADVYRYLSTGNVVARYQVKGSAGKKQLKQQLAFWKRKLK